MDFSSLISDHLTSLELNLAEGCERLAKEREASLREENKQLQQENEKLRLQLNDREGASSKPQGKTAPTGGDQDPPPAGPPLQAVSALECTGTSVVPADGRGNSNSNDTAKAPYPSGREGTAAPTFKLFSQFLNEDTFEGVVEAGDAGYFHRAEDSSADFRLDQHKSGTQRLLVDPSSTFRLCWDILGIPILAWDLITIPIDFAFDIGALGEDIFAGAGWCTLIYWSIDLPFTFLTGFFDIEGTLIMELRGIARNYMHGFFGLDLLIILADWSTVFGASALGKVKVMRVLRISRFVRLMRLRKLKQKIQTIEDSINSEWLLVILNLFGKLFQILMINHYVGCVWYWIGMQDIDIPQRRWTGALPYDYKGEKFIDSPWLFQYFTSLHWAIAQFTPGPHPVQPQNVTERVFSVFVLLFGLVIFSSFIAGVTQARMQLNKMMSKLDRDVWILNKFCQQHGVSRQLTVRMKRYIELVIVPQFHKLNVPDVALLPKLSAHLRAQLNNELVSQTLCIHPFFGHLRKHHDAAMNGVSNQCIENFPLARGDVAFGSGLVASKMYLVSDGELEYIPIGANVNDPENVLLVVKGRWVSEAVLWTQWVHQGQMQASIESRAMLVDSAKLRSELVKLGLVMGFVRKYGAAFISRLNFMAQEAGGMPSDLQDDISNGIPLAATPMNILGVAESSGLALLPRLMQ